MDERGVEVARHIRYGEDSIKLLILRGINYMREVRIERKRVDLPGILVQYSTKDGERLARYLLPTLDFQIDANVIRNTVPFRFEEKEERLAVILNEMHLERAIGQHNNGCDSLETQLFIDTNEPIFYYCPYSEISRMGSKEEEKISKKDLYGMAKKRAVYLTVRNIIDDFYGRGDLNLSPEKFDEDVRERANGNLRFDTTTPDITNFVGREKYLNDLHRLLRGREDERIGTRMVVIGGTVGVGKTQVAKKYVKDYGNCYNNVVWIDCNCLLRTEECFRKLARMLGILTNGTDAREKDLESITADVYNHFRFKNVLFVFDGVTHSKLDILPKSVNMYETYALLTSRNVDWSTKNAIVSILENFDDEEAESFISTVENKSQLMIRGLENNPWLLRKIIDWKNNSKESHSGGDAGVCMDSTVYSDIYPKLKQQIIICYKNIAKDEETKSLDDTLKLMSEKSMEILKKLLVEEYLDLSREEDPSIWHAVLLLRKYSLVKFEDGKVKIHQVVKFILESRWEHDFSRSNVFQAKVDDS